MDAHSPQPASPPKIFPLRAVTARIKAILLEATTRRFWVRAHLVSKQAGFRSGHFYCELVETDGGGRQVAKISAVIWKSSFDVINRKLQAAGAEDALKGNKEICAYCSIEYHDVHGLKLQIHDVDPTFGEAQIDRNRRLILERLKAEQLLVRNKALKLPAAVLRIGLITSQDSAAFSDFTKTLSASPFAFKVILATASMQGERLEEQVLAALQALIRLGVEAICLVRGGGSQVDLAWFDNERIARAIANSPIPVWVGIGHEIDVGVLDFVAHTFFKTPTALAESLVGRLKDLDDRLTIAESRLMDLVHRQLILTARELHRKAQGLQQGARKHLDFHMSQLELQVSNIRNGVASATNRSNSRLQEMTGRLRASVSHALRGRTKSLEAKLQEIKIATDHILDGHAVLLERSERQFRLARYERRLTVAAQIVDGQQTRLENLRPEKMLRRGYSITRDSSGTIVKSTASIEAGQRLVTQVADGYVESVAIQHKGDVDDG